MIFSPLERMMAFRYLRAKRREGFISVITGFSFIGILLGVATLIVVMSVMNGFRVEITKKILGLSGHITITGYERQLDNYDSISAKVAKVPGVVSAVPVINGQAMALAGENTVGVMVKGVMLSDLMKRPLIADHIVDGSIVRLQGNDSIMLGKALAEGLSVGVGDGVTLISPQGRATAIGTMPRMKKYTVVAIFEAGMYEYDSSGMFMPLDAAQVFFKYPESVSGIEVMLKDADKSQITAQNIFNILGQLYVVRDWQLINASLFNALKVERTVMFLILTLIVFIAAFNIISSLIMLVTDKGRDIAIMRTMGASRASIMRIFFLCGSAIGITGTLAGFVLGISFALNIDAIKKILEKLLGTRLFDPVIYFLSELPSDVRADDVIKAVFVGLFFSFIATIYPAWKASRQDPAEALRYE
jgi:lipoprotein-releasing system permease protein